MARRVPSFENPPPRRRYDWPNWTDSHVWEIFRGEDYDVATENMRVNLHERAKQEGKKVRTTIVRHGDGREGLRFQFYVAHDRTPLARRSPAHRRLHPVGDPRSYPGSA